MPEKTKPEKMEPENTNNPGEEHYLRKTIKKTLMDKIWALKADLDFTTKGAEALDKSLHACQAANRVLNHCGKGLRDEIMVAACALRSVANEYEGKKNPTTFLVHLADYLVLIAGDDDPEMKEAEEK